MTLETLGIVVFGSYLTPFLTVLAQSPDPIAGGAGWVGAGLLGLVLGWLLLVHLPAKDKQIMGLIADCDAHNENQRKQFVEENEKQRKEFLEESRESRLKFDSTLRYVTEQQTRQMERLDNHGWRVRPRHDGEVK